MRGSGNVASRSVAWLVIAALLTSSCASRSVPPIGAGGKPFKPESDELRLWAQAEKEEEQLQKKTKPYDDPLLDEYLGKIGGTGPRFPLSDPRQQWDSLRRLMLLDPKIEVWPGHDYGVRPSSTIRDEILTNPFLITKTFDEFIHLKEHWLEYKKAHNIA